MSTTFNYLDLNQNNFIEFNINNALLNINTIMMGFVVAIAPNGFLDIQPLQKIVGLNQTPQELPILRNVPFVRLMGGGAGIEIEYKKNDVVLLGVCQRDISIPKTGDFDPTTYAPPTFRKFNLSDAVVINKLSMTPPTIKIKITDDGIDIDSQDKNININANNVIVNASSVEIGGNTPVALQGGSVTVTGVQTGAGTATGTIDSGSSILKAGV